jgi:5'-nucleotidase
VVDLSGTVGAARAAASRGIPALALSQGLSDAPQYENAAKLAVAWLAKNRAALSKKPKSAALPNIESYNVPNCPSGKPRGVKTVTLATTSEGAIADVDCAAAVTKPTNDIEAFNAGWTSFAKVPTTPATPAS